MRDKAVEVLEVADTRSVRTCRVREAATSTVRMDTQRFEQASLDLPWDPLNPLIECSRRLPAVYVELLRYVPEHTRCSIWDREINCGRPNRLGRCPLPNPRRQTAANARKRSKREQIRRHRHDQVVATKQHCAVERLNVRAEVDEGVVRVDDLAELLHQPVRRARHPEAALLMPCKGRGLRSS